MPKYEVILPWHGVVIGDVFDAEKIHPSLTSHVRESASSAKLIPATPKEDAPAKGKPGPKPKQEADSGE